MNIRQASGDDFEAIWPIFQHIVAAGDTYAYARQTSKDQARTIWLVSPKKTYVAEIEGVIVGTYFIKTNQAGPGDHVCNCGYMVAPAARRTGIATLMCEHSQHQATLMGYKAMQFNFVAASNTSAISLWQKLGFSEVGRLPKAFAHPHQGLIDAMVMYKWLDANLI